MDSEDFYIRLSTDASAADDYANQLQDYLSAEAAREGISLSMSVEAAGQESPRLKLSAGDNLQKVLEWMLFWLQKNPSITAFAESQDGSSSIKLSPPEEESVKRPERLPDSEFRMEFKTFDRWWES